MFSPSELNLFFQCPQRWKWMKDGVPGLPVDTRLLDIGSEVHYIIRLYFERLSGVPTEDEIEQKVLDITDEVVGDKKSVMNLMNKFIHFEKERLKTWKTYLPTFVEKKFVYNDYLTGIVDFYGENKIIDWKTGTYTYITPDMVRQGNIYRFLLENAGYQVDDILFVYIKEDKVVSIPKVPDGSIQNDINKMRNMIKSGYLPKREGYYCAYCEYQLRCELEKEGITLWKL